MGTLHSTEKYMRHAKYQRKNPKMKQTNLQITASQPPPSYNESRPIPTQENRKRHTCGKSVKCVAGFLNFCFLLALLGYFFIYPIVSDIVKGEVIKTYPDYISNFDEDPRVQNIIDDLESGKSIDKNTSNYLKKITLLDYERNSCESKSQIFEPTFYQRFLDFDNDCDYLFRWWTNGPKFISYGKNLWFIKIEYIQTRAQWLWLTIMMVLMVFSYACGCSIEEKKKRKDVVYPINEEDSRSET